MSISIDTGITVSLHFSLELQDGQMIDSNFEDQPATLVVGDGNLLPGFEASLIGLLEGDEREFNIPPEQAFGQSNPQNIQSVARSSFSQDDVQIGEVFSFQNGDGELPGVIIDKVDDQILVDFNHPLAGQCIIFRVKIISVSLQKTH